jgi:hypothetical protein
MNFLKKTVATILILGTITQISAFEQNGVKEGNSRVSIGLTSIVDNDDGSDGSGTFYGQYGKFITDNIEIASYIFANLSDGGQQSGENLYYNVDRGIDYQIAIGLNYYFLKTVTLTPYIGIQYYHTDSTRDSYKYQKNGDYYMGGHKVDYTSDGDRCYLGLHKFFSENLAVTPEAGMRFVDFTDYMNTYFNIYLTYFFD